MLAGAFRRKGASRLTLIIGGARSGTSDYAERLAMQELRPVLGIAAGHGLDHEMQKRVPAQRDSRAADWRTAELPVLSRAAFPGTAAAMR